MTQSPALLTTEQDGILIATLNRPDKLNALNRETMDLLTDAVIHFRNSHELKVMLIRATGRYFCAGADLKGGEEQKKISPTKHTASGIRENHRLNLNNMQQLWDEMEHIEKPFVVAHQGMCVGAAWNSRSPAISGSRRKARDMRFRKESSECFPLQAAYPASPASAVRIGRAG